MIQYGDTNQPEWQITNMIINDGREYGRITNNKWINHARWVGIIKHHWPARFLAGFIIETSWLVVRDPSGWDWKHRINQPLYHLCHNGHNWFVTLLTLPWSCSHLSWRHPLLIALRLVKFEINKNNTRAGYPQMNRQLWAHGEPQCATKMALVFDQQVLLTKLSVPHFLPKLVSRI